MKKVLHYEFLFWILLSVSLFVFILPIPSDILIKIISGYVFYSFIVEVFSKRLNRVVDVENRIETLQERIENSPHDKNSVYIYGHLAENANKTKKEDLRKYI